MMYTLTNNNNTINASENLIKMEKFPRAIFDKIANGKLASVLIHIDVLCYVEVCGDSGKYFLSYGHLKNRPISKKDLYYSPWSFF